MTQEQALAILKTGGNVFLTGEPGSGKTHTVNRYIEYLHAHDLEPAVTASTGIAATHLSGMTIHAWSGIGTRKELTHRELDELAQREKLVRRITRTNILIIDEISMLDARILTLLDQVCQHLRRSHEPFGGVQLVVVGDFFQLPPVADTGQQAHFAFASPAWDKANFLVCYLTEQYRQDDPQFFSVLKALRSRHVSDDVHAMLASRIGEPQDAIATKLYTHNRDVDRINAEQLGKIDTPAHRFAMSSKGAKHLIEGLKRTCLSPEDLVLKQGAVVMFTKNDIEQKFVNGTLGVVVGFDSDSGYPVVETRDHRYLTAQPVDWTVEEQNRVLARVTQVPLRLAWAITVHKSQGMSMDAAVIDLSKSFEYGQGYVALSRVRTLAGLYLLGLNERALEVHPTIAERDRDFLEHSRVAEEAFAAIAAEELKEMHDNVIRAMGGSFPKQGERGPAGAKRRRGKPSTYEQTRILLAEGKTPEEIAKERSMAASTIMGHLEKLRRDGHLDENELEPLRRRLSQASLEDIHTVFSALETEKLTPVYEHFGGRFTYEELRLARLLREL